MALWIKHKISIDSSGEFVLQTGDIDIRGEFGERFTFANMSPQGGLIQAPENAPSELVSYMPEKIAKALADVLK